MDCSVFITLGIYTPLEAHCVLLTIIAWVAHRYGQLYLLLINILLGSFQLFLHNSDQPLWGWNNPVQRCLPVGAALSTPEAVVASRGLTNCFDVQPTTTSGNIITQSIIFSFSIQLTPSCILHRAQQHHADASACQKRCRVRQLQFSGIFVALGFVGNGVITVMINSPWQADDDADNQSGEIIAVTLLIHQSLWPFHARFFEFCNQAVQPYARTDHNQRPAVKPRYCCNGRLPDGYHHDQS